MSQSTETMERIVALCRRRGFIFGSSEIYGGIGGFWDYGPLGCELKRNVKDVWWEDMVRNPPTGPNGREFQMVGVDCSIIMNPKVWEASGHVGGFKDPMIACRSEGCKGLFRLDQVFHILLRRSEGTDPFDFFSVEANSEEDARQAALPKAEKLSKKHRGGAFVLDAVPFSTAAEKDYQSLKCPRCDQVGSFTEPRAFNLMFESYTGALQDSSNKVYLRPETAQGIFVNFKNVMDSTRVKIPFGIAQVGKAFRNEINPRNFTFRSREFEQMEIEFFCNPKESRMWYEYWRDVRKGWYTSLGIKSDKLRPREQGQEELAHYSCGTTDIEYLFPFSDEPQELEGVAHRGDYDLKQHQEHSGKDMTYFDDENKERYLPHVIEPSAGADRFTLAVICEAYTRDESRASPEFLKFHPRLAPIKAAVFPLVAKDGLPELAEPIYREIRKHFPCQYDAKQSIGKRYARMDEAGTPYCFTIDGQTREDGTVTVRNRDDGGQIRIDKSQCLQYLRDQLRL
jgi:glycyl-tRNA synthetase